jgi:deferrochelatase/peroxidase EfeB
LTGTIRPVTEPETTTARPPSEADGPAHAGTTPPGQAGLSRRQLLGAAAAGAAGLAVGGLAVPLVVSRTGLTGNQPVSSAYPFHGPNQAGITTPVQDHLQFAAFDMAAEATRSDLEGLLRDWSAAASRLTQGLEVSEWSAVGGQPQAPPGDTGETLDLPPSGLTVTIGLGPGLFEKDGVDRFGLGPARPSALSPLPAFVGDVLRDEWSGGDLCLQVCTDDPNVAVHAVRNLARIASGRAAIRWSQMGFGRTSRTSPAQVTPRNLLGFKDGTNNILAEETAALAQHVWIGGEDGRPWLAGGSYLVVRKIEMLIEAWDRTSLAEQEATFGRTKRTGAPLSGGDEFTEPDFEARAGGGPAIDPAAHIRLAHQANAGGIRILRRGYNYVDGTDQRGKLNAGLLFIAYQRTPTQFVTLQRSLAGTDLLNEYIQHIGSALFVVPPGASPGGFVGEGLFA